MEKEIAVMALELTKAFYLGQERKSDLSKQDVFETFNEFMKMLLESKAKVDKRIKRIPIR